MQYSIISNNFLLVKQFFLFLFAEIIFFFGLLKRPHGFEAARTLFWFFVIFLKTFERFCFLRTGSFTAQDRSAADACSTIR